MELQTKKLVKSLSYVLGIFFLAFLSFFNIGSRSPHKSLIGEDTQLDDLLSPPIARADVPFLGCEPNCDTQDCGTTDADADAGGSGGTNDSGSTGGSCGSV